MAGVTLLVLALAGACTTSGAPAAPRTPAPVQAAWPGCEGTGFAVDPTFQGDASPPTGGVPAGFEARSVVLCEVGERTNARGDTVSVDLERTSTQVAPLLAYLAQPDDTTPVDACTADAWLPPWLFLVDGDGRYVAPAIPVDECGKPAGWTRRENGLAWESLTYTDVVVRENGVNESAEARRSGCAMGWKDAVDDYAHSSHHRSGTLGRDPFPDGVLSVCVFEVPQSDRGTDAPPGDFVIGRKLDEQERAAVVAALVAAPEAAVRCTEKNARFATVTPHDGGPIVYVELDGCRRVVSDGETTPVVRADDELVALLGG